MRQAFLVADGQGLGDLAYELRCIVGLKGPTTQDHRKVLGFDPFTDDVYGSADAFGVQDPEEARIGDCCRVLRGGQDVIGMSVVGTHDQHAD